MWIVEPGNTQKVDSGGEKYTKCELARVIIHEIWIGINKTWIGMEENTQNVDWEWLGWLLRGFGD